MTQFNQLSGSSSLSGGDLLAIQKSSNSRTQNIPAQDTVPFYKAQIAPVAIVFNTTTSVITLTLGDGTIITGTVDNGGAIVPGTFEVAGSSGNGSYISNAMPVAFTEMWFATFRFLNASNVQVAPTAGTVTITASNDGVNYFSINNGVFNAIDVYLPTRPQPSASGPITFVKITLNGVTGNGVTQFNALITRA